MNNNINYQDLTSILLGLDVKYDYSLKSLNRYGTGGNAKAVVFPSSSEELKYAVNNKNGKIHIIGECAATGTGKSAMKEPVYFATYEEALAYSEKIEPGEDKRQCGNCW